MSEALHDQIARVVDGDRDATARLYDHFAPRLYRRLRARYGPAGLDAEELLQDAFVLFLQHDARVLRRLLERHAPAALNELTVHTYLWDQACGIASNRRRAQRRTGVVSVVGSEMLADDSHSRRTITSDLLERLDDCLAGKNPRVYLYFKLRFVDGLSPDEVAQATGWSRKATYKLRQQFNAALADCAARLELTP